MNIEEKLIAFCRHFIVRDWESCNKMYRDIHEEISKNTHHICLNNSLGHVYFWERQNERSREIFKKIPFDFSSCNCDCKIMTEQHMSERRIFVISEEMKKTLIKYDTDIEIIAKAA